MISRSEAVGVSPSPSRGESIRNNGSRRGKDMVEMELDDGSEVVWQFLPSKRKNLGTGADFVALVEDAIDNL